MKYLLDIIRHCPSGDNEQPWTFNILGPNKFEFFVKDNRNYYNFDGRMTALTIGMLTSIIEEAAYSLGYWAKIENNTVTLSKYHDNMELPCLGDYIEARGTNRGLYKLEKLNDNHRKSLSAIPEVVWLPNKFKMAKINAKASFIKLNDEDAYNHHKKVIDFDDVNSCNGIPAASLNLDSTTLKIMRWGMQDFKRLKYLPKLLPILEMDYLPSLFCSTHYAIMADDDFTGGHVAMRFMLLAEQLGLQHQPMMSPLILARKGLMKEELMDVIGKDYERIVWMGRIGYGRDPIYRAGRRID